MALNKRTRVIVDVPSDLRRRIRMAAAARDISVRAYVVDALEVALSREPEGRRKGKPVTEETIRRLREIREGLMQGRVFEDDSTDFINQARADRTATQDNWNTGPIPARPTMPAGYGIADSGAGEALSWDVAQQWLTSARNYWIASTRPDGGPHVMPVWGLWLDGAVYFSTDPDSRKGRNIAARPEIVVHLESGDQVVVLEGRAERIGGEELPASLADDYEAKYGYRMDTTNQDTLFYRLRPRVAFTWREQDFPTSATRWRF